MDKVGCDTFLSIFLLISLIMITAAGHYLLGVADELLELTVQRPQQLLALLVLTFEAGQQQRQERLMVQQHHAENTQGLSLKQISLQ